MSYQFVRLRDDGMIASALPFKFESRAEAEAKAPVILLSRRGGKFALVQIITAVSIVGHVSYADKQPTKK